MAEARAKTPLAWREKTGSNPGDRSPAQQRPDLFQTDTSRNVKIWFQAAFLCWLRSRQMRLFWIFWSSLKNLGVVVLFGSQMHVWMELSVLDMSDSAVTEGHIGANPDLCQTLWWSLFRPYSCHRGLRSLADTPLAIYWQQDFYASPSFSFSTFVKVWCERNASTVSPLPKMTNKIKTIRSTSFSSSIIQRD